MDDELKQPSSGPGMDAVERSRLCRASRYANASQLLQLAESLEPDLSSSTMDSLDVDSLDKMPHWCAMDDASLQQFQRLIGASFLAPALKNCIDGSRLADWRNVMGKTLFEEVISGRLFLGLESMPKLPDSLPIASESLLLAYGASILLSTLTDHAAQPLMEQRFMGHHGLVSKELAVEIHSMAMTALQQSTDAMGFESAPNDDAHSTSIAQAMS